MRIFFAGAERRRVFAVFSAEASADIKGGP
jgi:hypothetical protein